jgi:histidinol-phosphate aminotransferase
MKHYEKPAELYDGLRLHQNENTGGCSPLVLKALASLRPDQVGFYPPYAEATDACARHFGVESHRVMLVNGLDEGIMAIAATLLRPTAATPAPGIPEGIIPQPAFEIFAYDTNVAGGRVVNVPPARDFAFPLDGVLAAITDATRVVFLTNPNNPTGVSMPLDAIRTIAQHVPPDAVVLVDEAYADFAGTTFIPVLTSFPNVIVGRTFSKAYGLAGLRIGCLIGAPDVIDRLRPAVPVYSVNIAAVIALQAALQDPGHVQRYLAEVAESKRRLYTACDRLGLKYWKSDANFVLVSAGDRVESLVAGVLTRGIYLRDRSNEPGCAGCLRITTGVVEHTQRCIQAIEEVLCGAA